MRLVAFGILAAMVFGAGCALQAGDPGEPGASTEPGPTLTTARIHQAGTPPVAGSAAPPNPEPSPWLPTGPAGGGLDEDSTGANPEPSPWQPDPLSQGALTTGTPQSGSAGSTTENANGSTPNRPGHLGAL
jgi:hypothetical protein